MATNLRRLTLDRIAANRRQARIQRRNELRKLRSRTPQETRHPRGSRSEFLMPAEDVKAWDAYYAADRQRRLAGRAS